MLVYLDSSAIVKRYIEETGSLSVDILYSSLENEQGTINQLFFSSWNVGEVLGAIDTRHRRGDIDDSAMGDALNLFSQETRKFVAMRRLSIVPVGAKILTNSRDLILKYHIYQADALQLASAKQAKAGLFVSADRKLIECARSEQLEAATPEVDYDFIVDTLSEGFNDKRQAKKKSKPYVNKP